MKLQSYVDMLNRVEVLRTWKTSGVTAAMFALLAYAVLSMAGRTEWIGDITLAVAALAGAIGKFASELKRLGDGERLPKPADPCSPASDTADFVPKKPA